MQRRIQENRRIDGLTAERFDLAVLAARAFDLRAGQSYLTLSGIRPSLVQGFLARYPDGLRRMPAPRHSERRRPSA